MKLKHRFVIFAVGTVVFVLFVSYKILEPELPLERAQDEQDGDNFISVWGKDIQNVPDFPQDGQKLTQKPGMEYNHSSTASEKQTIIDSLLNKYDIDWHYKLTGSPWTIAARWVTPRRIVPDVSPELGGILHEMATRTIVGADFGYRGTQLKLSLELAGGQRVAFKPKWYSRERVITGKPYEGRDRHNGEIAAFHLNRLLGLGRSPLVVGRVIDLEEDILPVAHDRLIKTFFEKKGNTCFYGKCMYCHGPKDGVCADGTKLEGTVVLWLPKDFTLSKLHRHPWGRTYKANKTARWEEDNSFCSIVHKMPGYNSGPRLLDILDAAVFDYLIGNADRHHYETFAHYNYSMLVMLDSGKSFGNPSMDEMTILAPLYQCCQLRKSMHQRLLQLKNGVLSHVMRKILAKDPLTPVLAEPHYEAMDRRLVYILDMVDSCVDKNSAEFVLVTDQYSEIS